MVNGRVLPATWGPVPGLEELTFYPFKEVDGEVGDMLWWDQEKEHFVCGPAYELAFIEQLANSENASVWMCMRRENGMLCALKVVHERDGSGLELGVNEEKVLSERVPGCIPYAFGLGLGMEWLMIVHPDHNLVLRCFMLEFAKWGSLFGVSKKHQISEDNARIVLNGLCTAVAGLHEKNYVHLDINPTNILFKLELFDSVHLADFGYARMTSENGRIQGPSPQVLTQGYTAPEMTTMEIEDARKIDVWNLGAVLFFMLTGRSPGDGASGEEIESYNNISHDAKALVRQLMAIDPRKRPSIAAVEKEAWMRGNDEHTPQKQSGSGSDCGSSCSRRNARRECSIKKP
jgi:serine/threonine protein kinase